MRNRNGGGKYAQEGLGSFQADRSDVKACVKQEGGAHRTVQESAQTFNVSGQTSGLFPDGNCGKDGYLTGGGCRIHEEAGKGRIYQASE